MIDITYEYIEILLGSTVHTEWGQRILTAFDNGGFTAEDRMLASKWETCACAGLTITPLILVQGMTFQHYILNNNVVEAAKTLQFISVVKESI